jgi:hypothetical protein
VKVTSECDPEGHGFGFPWSPHALRENVAPACYDQVVAAVNRWLAGEASEIQSQDSILGLS